MANTCPICMANMDMVGRAHRCIAKAPAAAAVVTAVPSETGAGQSTYKYRDPDARREYMRGYMKRRRSN